MPDDHFKETDISVVICEHLRGKWEDYRYNFWHITFHKETTKCFKNVLEENMFLQGYLWSKKIETRIAFPSKYLMRFTKEKEVVHYSLVSVIIHEED